MNRKLLCLIMALGLAACTTPGPPDYAVRDVIPVKNKQEAELRSITVVYDPDAKTNMNMAALVPGNIDSTSVWREALTDALNRSVLFQDDQKLKVSLSVRIVEIWYRGGAMVVTALHEIIDRATGKILFAEDITGSCHLADVPSSEAWSAPRKGYEMAIQDNIKQFISTVSEINLAER